MAPESPTRTHTIRPTADNPERLREEKGRSNGLDSLYLSCST
jgi:hypothetical protein